MLLTSVLCKHACASVPCRHAVLYSVQCVVCHVLLWKRSEYYLIYLTVCAALALCFHPAGSPRAVPGRANAKAHRWSRHPSHMPRTRYLTTAQLQAVLRGRGVVLPEGGAQPHAFYLDLCHSQGLEEVTSAELEEAMQKSPRRGGAAAAAVAALPATAATAALPAALVINLPRHTQRRSSVSSRLQLAGVPFEWAPAVDGERLTMSNLTP